jgi:hypothetical protein
MQHRGNPRELYKGEKEEVRNGRGRKEQSQYATQGQPKGTLKGEGERSHSITKGQPKGTLKGGGGGSEKRKREKGAVTVLFHTGATKGNFKRGKEEVRNGRGRKEKSQCARQGQPKGTLIGEGGVNKKRKWDVTNFLIAWVPFCRPFVRFSMDCMCFFEKSAFNVPE